MTRLSYLSLIHLSTIPAMNADYAIKFWKPILKESGLYEKYKHLNPASLIYKNWLDVLSKKYVRKEWLDYKMWLITVLLAESKEAELPRFYLLKKMNLDENRSS